MRGRIRSPFIRFPFLLLIILILTVTTVSLVSGAGRRRARRLTVESVESLGLVTFETGYMYDDTEVGGLSGIAYDWVRGRYYALSDDRSDSRYYTVSIDVSDGSLDEGDVTFQDVTFLKRRGNRPFPDGTIDPEGVELARPGQMYISSEGDADAAPPIDPFVNRFNPTGRQNRALRVPFKFLPDGEETWGVWDNLAFESLTVSRDRRTLVTATEAALVQDGEPSTVDEGSPARFLEYDTRNKRPGAEYVYMVSPIPVAPPDPDDFADNGLVDLQALDSAGTYLAMERNYTDPVGNTVVLFETSSQDATDVSDYDVLPDDYEPMSKEWVTSMAELGIDPDNLEGMTFGPPLPDGRFLLILVSDNNFNDSQVTQFIALAVELGPADSAWLAD